MDIIEELQAIVAEQEQVDLGYDLPTRAWVLYEYLKDKCVGFDNAKSAKELVGIIRNNYDNTFEYDERQLRKDIRALRTTLPRRIGSSSKGYWLMTADDEIKGTSLLVSQFLSITETLTQQGIDTKLLHAIVGALAKKQGKEVDGQLTLKITKHLRDTIHTLSDDLKGE